MCTVNPCRKSILCMLDIIDYDGFLLFNRLQEDKNKKIQYKKILSWTLNELAMQNRGNCRYFRICKQRFEAISTGSDREYRGRNEGWSLNQYLWRPHPGTECVTDMNTFYNRSTKLQKLLALNFPWLKLTYYKPFPCLDWTNEKCSKYYIWLSNVGFASYSV